MFAHPLVTLVALVTAAGLFWYGSRHLRHRRHDFPPDSWGDSTAGFIANVFGLIATLLCFATGSYLMLAASRQAFFAGNRLWGGAGMVVCILAGIWLFLFLFVAPSMERAQAARSRI